MFIFLMKMQSHISVILCFPANNNTAKQYFISRVFFFSQVRMSVLSLRSLDRVAPTDVAFTTILFPVSASSSGMVVVKETETTSPHYKPVSRGVEEMAVFFHQVNLSFLKATTVYINSIIRCSHKYAFIYIQTSYRTDFQIVSKYMYHNF